ncbi:MAG: hypothetical protein ACRDTC_02020, partial [Pseudonocardiaceae bacterium]
RSSCSGPKWLLSGRIGGKYRPPCAEVRRPVRYGGGKKVLTTFFANPVLITAKLPGNTPQHRSSVQR